MLGSSERFWDRRANRVLPIDGDCMQVLIVDDSSSMRSAVRAALTDVPGIVVCGSVPNGDAALALVDTQTVDAIVLDMEMPVMDGLATLRALQARSQKPVVIVFAAPSPGSYGKVLEALRLGADDFVAKPAATQDGLAGAIESIRNQIVPRLLRDRVRAELAEAVGAPPQDSVPTTRRVLANFRPKAVVIASSTGGPLALERLLRDVHGPLRVPIIIAQHMPPPFTQSLAERLGRLTGVPAAEAVDGEKVSSNRIYVAAADFHTELARRDGGLVFVVHQGPRVNFVRPAADLLFTSGARVLGSDLMAFVLTGMGEDGRVGCGDIKKKGGGVMIQDRATSVVWGMPGAVHADGMFDDVGSLDECAAAIVAMTSTR